MQKTGSLKIIDWGRLDYGHALRRQKELVDERIAGRCSDHLVFVEHPPVVTLGRSGGLFDLCVSEHTLHRKNVEIFTVERGGRATFHGPGQMVTYPIIRLKSKDLHVYLYRLLDVAAQVVQSFGLVPEFRQGQPGIWVGGAKIASVGIAVRKWVTFHGLALNVNTDTDWFRLIVPCGRSDEKITSISHELGKTIELSEVKTRFTASFRRIFGYIDPTARQGPHPQWLVRPPVDIECFGRGVATFMILGTRCTRRCRFCAVEKGTPEAVDAMEPSRVALAAQQLGLTHVVVTSVTRDDLPDGGAGHFVDTVRHIREKCPNASIEVLVPDFDGDCQTLQMVCDAQPDVFNHNIETVSRLYARIRPQADYRRSLSVLSYAAGRGLRVKSGLMLGLGETDSEVRRLMRDLLETGCISVTIGQYLAPSKKHQPVARYVRPDEFDQWAATARAMGFTSVASAPLVRSSYRADEMRVFKPVDSFNNHAKGRVLCH
ncbi:MAG: lipoyl synthase [Deltaproteobacteria bacterium]|nr:lipoyl synthase [Deltaproteobacteria bacterium]